MKRIRTLLFSSFVLAGLSAAASLSVQLPEGVDRAFSVWSADGRRVVVPFVRTGTTLKLDVHALAPGVYVLRIGNGVARFVKQ